jgi:hypothetical protein
VQVPGIKSAKRDRLGDVSGEKFVASKKDKKSDKKALKKKKSRKQKVLLKEQARKARRAQKRSDALAAKAKKVAKKLAREAKEKARKGARKATKKAARVAKAARRAAGPALAPGSARSARATPQSSKPRPIVVAPAVDPASRPGTVEPSSAWTVVALRARARSMAIPGYSQMTKAQLVERLTS